jgi:hypothetical protein
MCYWLQKFKLSIFTLVLPIICFKISEFMVSDNKNIAAVLLCILCFHFYVVLGLYRGQAR